MIVLEKINKTDTLLANIIKGGRKKHKYTKYEMTRRR